jgi:16S rRNA (guanine527-N7)-methyltransferase
MNDAQNMLVTELRKLQIDLPTDTLDKLFGFIDLLLEANEHVNLTAITEYQEALIKHLYDCLIILNRPEYEAAKRILDVGSGGGVPCIPLAICSPQKQFISLDSVQKKIKFQEQACQTLQIANIKPIWARAEDFIKNTGVREQLDLILARAVAPLNVLAEITLPFIKLNGYALFYKGKDYQNELQEAKKAIAILGGTITDTVSANLPFNLGTRSLIAIKKNLPSPYEYPRKAGVPQKKPL